MQGFHLGPGSGKIDWLSGQFCLAGLTIYVKILLLKIEEQPGFGNIFNIKRRSLVKKNLKM